jgi:hypothetical protein
MASQYRTLAGRTLRPARPFAAALVLAGLAVTARAQSPTAPPEGDDWKFAVAPYLMGASLDGDAVLRGRPAKVDIGASDIFNHLDVGFMGMAAARKGDWGVVTDVVLVDLSVESQAPPADVSPSIGLFSVQGVRKLSDVADATAGVRWNRLEARIDFKAPISQRVEKTRDWVDPVVGIVLRTPGRHRVHATLIADVGGFGVGSDLTWQAFPSVGVNLGKHASLEGGWRFLSTDYKTGEGAERFEWDVLYQGPVVGFAFTF